MRIDSTVQAPSSADTRAVSDASSMKAFDCSSLAETGRHSAHP